MNNIDSRTTTASVAVIIPVFNRCETTLKCLRQLSQVDWAGVRHTIIVVDDGSTDGTAEAVMAEFPEVVLLRGSGNLWWTGAINLGSRHAVETGADFVLFANDDLEFDPGFFLELWNVATRNPGALVSGMKLQKHEDGHIKIICGAFDVEGFLQQIRHREKGESIETLQSGQEISSDLLSGAVLLVPTATFGEIGFLNEATFPHNWGDFEFTRRAKLQGYSCLIAPRAHVFTDGYNPNYHDTYILGSTRREYIRNLFESRKYLYGFKSIWRNSLMHKPLIPGLSLYLRRLAALFKWLLLKVFLPRRILKRLMSKKK